MVRFRPGFGGEKRAFRAWKPDQKPGFPMEFRCKAENKPTIEKRNRAFRGGFRGGFRMISLFTVAFGARDCWFKALSDCCSGIHSRWLLPPQTEECHPRVSMTCTVRVFPRKRHADPCRESGRCLYRGFTADPPSRSANLRL